MINLSLNKTPKKYNIRTRIFYVAIHLKYYALQEQLLLKGSSRN